MSFYYVMIEGQGLSGDVTGFLTSGGLWASSEDAAVEAFLSYAHGQWEKPPYAQMKTDRFALTVLESRKITLRQYLQIWPMKRGHAFYSE